MKVSDAKEFLELLLTIAPGGPKRPIFLFTGAAVLAVSVIIYILFQFGYISVGVALPLGIVVIAVWFIFVYLHPKNEAPVDLAILKGANPFAEKDGDLFVDLGRATEIRDLKDWVTGEQVAVIFVWGPSGVGKTSLVNVGLRKALSEDDHHFLYVDANQENFQDVLKEDILQHLPARTRKQARTLEQLLAAERKSKQVVVVDNADLARDHESVSRLVRAALDSSPRYRRVLVIILDEESYAAHWESLQWRSRSREALKRLGIRRFNEPQARAVISVLKEHAHLSFTEELADELVRGASLSGGGEVSPLTLSIELQFVGKATAGGHGFGLDEYEASGKETGAMIVHIEEHLSPANLRILRDLLPVIGKNGSLAAKQFAWVSLQQQGWNWKDNELRSLLDSLSSQELRVFRADHGQESYKILDEWIAPLERMLEVPEPAVASLNDRVRMKFELWSQRQYLGRGPFRFLREWPFLLTGKEIRLIEKNKGKLRSFGAPLFQAYLRRSRLQRRMVRVVAFILLATCASLAPFGYGLVEQWKADDRIRGWGLPRDFKKYENQFTDLAVVCMVDDLHLLPRNLASLDASCERIRSLAGIPPSVRHLGLSLSGVTSLAGLPSSVESLNVSNTGISDIDSLSARDIRVLDISTRPFRNMKLLPRSVTSLKLQHEDISELEGLPDELVDLEVRGTTISSLKGLPKKLRRLVLARNPALVKLDALPQHLSELDTDVFTASAAEVPQSLRSLILTGIQIDNLPHQGIRRLELRKSTVTSDLPVSLQVLRYHDAFYPVDIDKLPPGLRRLKVIWPRGADFNRLPKQLMELDLSRSEHLTSISGIGRVSELNISSTPIPDFRDVPRSVTTLRFELCTAKGLSEFPADLERLYLGGCEQLELLENLPNSLKELDIRQTSISHLGELPGSLQRLDISNTKLSGRLPKLPPNLVEITLHSGQIDSLKGLPGSVRKISFVNQRSKRDDSAGVLESSGG